jgi:hypothetical protein
MIEPKVGQVWNHKDSKLKEVIVTIDESKWIHTNKGPRWMADFTENFIFNKEETLKHLKQQQEEINQQIEELNKPEIVKHKFEVIVHAPKNFDSNRIFNSLDCTVYKYWTDGDITNHSVDVIKE